MSVFWILYGMAGLLGFQNIPAKYQGHRWTKAYIRNRGVQWLMLGLPWLGFYLVRTFLLAEAGISSEMEVVILLLLALPALTASIVWERKYKARLSADADADRKSAERLS